MGPTHFWISLLFLSAVSSSKFLSPNFFYFGPIDVLTIVAEGFIVVLKTSKTSQVSFSASFDPSSWPSLLLLRFRTICKYIRFRYIYNNIVCSPLVHLNFSKFQFCEFLEREYSSKLFWLLSTSPTLISFKYLFYSGNISVSLPLLSTTILFASLLNLPYVYIIFCIISFLQNFSIGFRILLIIINYIIKIYLLLTWSLLLRHSDIL